MATKPTTTLEGTVAGDDVVVMQQADLYVTGSATPIRSRVERTFTLDVDGAPVDVEVTNATRVLSLEDVRGTWEEVSAHPAASGFHAKAPAPDAHVRLTWGTVRGGDRIVVKGVVLRTERGGGGYRDATTRPRAVRATRIAWGEEARGRVDKVDDDRERVTVPRPKPPQLAPRGPGLLVAAAWLAGLVAVTAAIAIPDTAYSLDWQVFGVGSALSAVVLVRRIRPPYELFEGQRLGAAWTPGFLGMTIICCGWMALGPLTIDVPSHVDAGHRAYVGTIGFLGWAVWGAVLLAFTWFWERAEIRTARRVLAGRPHSSPPVDGQWGTSEGTVEDAALHVEGQAVACASIFEETWNEGSTPNGKDYTSRRAPFRLVRDDGMNVTVSPDGLVAAGLVVSGQQDASAIHQKVLLRAFVVPTGERAIVLGRMRTSEHGAALALGVGADSLVVVGGPHPRRMLRKRLLSAYATFALLLAFTVGLVVVSAYHPFLPELYSSGDD